MLENYDDLLNSLEGVSPDVAIHLAAQAGVRYSITNPRDFINSNIIGNIQPFECHFII